MCYVVMECITLSGVYQSICNSIMINVDYISAYVPNLKRRAIRAAQSITQRLDDYWMGVRLQKLNIPKALCNTRLDRWSR